MGGQCAVNAIENRSISQRFPHVQSFEPSPLKAFSTIDGLPILNPKTMIGLDPCMIRNLQCYWRCPSVVTQLLIQNPND